MSQDLPPQGGYGPVQYRRNLPPRGFRPAFYIFATFAVCSELLREKRWARIHLVPVLQAEEDRDMVRRVWAGERREELLMKDVKGWKLGSVYHSDRCISPNPQSIALNIAMASNTSNIEYEYYRFVKPSFVPTPAQITPGLPPHYVPEQEQEAK
ncbi:hypothetical protein Dda_4607 [Drechslerella dactyloides]|uniref:NADH dehydrogenase [ubiquinone] 1 alpha subcomplex subunit 13 n=1 Tax=Drechslerella dactyloides TaxID=74499 RepID=A0AAD6NI34_DREDA|nr:hypothetical protein Dda_4607 [Drechslerella dactyloides]